MQKLLIVCIIAATGPLILVPTSATAAGYGAGISCVPSTQQGSTCDDKQDVFRRLYDLEVKVDAQQARIAQLEAKMEARTDIQAAGVSGASVESRLSQLEERFAGLQGLLVQVVAMLTQLIGRIH